MNKKILLFAVLVSGCVVLAFASNISSCPNQKAASIGCPILPGYSQLLCETLPFAQCSGTIEVPESDDWGTSYSWCNYVIEGGGTEELCYTHGRCLRDTTLEVCYSSLPTEVTKFTNKNGEDGCDNPECIIPPQS